MSGVCLACVQQAERALQTALGTVLGNEYSKLVDQSEPEKKQTLGDFIRKLKQRFKLPIRVKDDLYTFLSMRNQLVHEFKFGFQTEDGRTEARPFLLELTARAISVTGLLVAIFSGVGQR